MSTIGLLLQICFALIVIVQQANSHQSTDEKVDVFDARSKGHRHVGQHEFIDTLNGETVPVLRNKRQASKYLEADKISTHYFYGAPQVKSSFIDCGHGENCTIKSTFQHSENVRHSGGVGIKLEAGSILEICPSVTVDKARGSATSTLYEFVLSGNSRARVLFKPRLVKINGVVKMKRRCLGRGERILGGIITLGTSEFINSGRAECEQNHDLGPFEIIAPVSSVRGEKHDELDGEWFVEYADNPMPVDDVNYHNIRDRDLNVTSEDLRVDTTVANPIMCGKYAKAYGYKVAVYKNATCHLKKTNTYHDREIMTQSGKFIGEYTIESKSSNKTQIEEAKEYWIRHRMCDMIQYVKEFYRCINLPKLERAVVMFKIEKEETQLDNTEPEEPIIN